jgi:hypothetical protein
VCLSRNSVRAFVDRRIRARASTSRRSTAVARDAVGR